MYSKSEAIVFLVFMSIFILVMVIFIIRILFFAQKKQIGFHNDLLEMKANYERELYKAQSEIQEQTCQEIANEIHDNVAQCLSLAKLGLNILDLDSKEKMHESLAEISKIIEKTITDLRNISQCLNPETIKNGGLITSIDRQVSYFQRVGKFSIHFFVNGNPITLPSKKEIFLFRIVQEAINNTIKHSRATDIKIFLTYEKDLLVLKICDNGKGFDLKEKYASPGQLSGLLNMHRRAKIMESQLEIDSQIGKGTAIKVTTPFYNS